MKQKFIYSILVAALVLVFLGIGIPWAYGKGMQNVQASSQNQANLPQTGLGSAFTYQGELEDAGAAADGTYDFSFRLLDGADPGTASQVGATVDVNGVDVVAGIFTVELDFGFTPFTGEARWLEISVGRTGDPLTILTPTQPLTAVPYALYGEDADADPANELNTNIAFIGTVLQITDAGGTQSQDIGTFNGNLVVTTNGRLGVREPLPITDIQLTQSDGLIGGTGGMTFSRSTNWKIMHTGSHFSFIENNVRRSYIETGTGNYVVTSDRNLKTDVAPLGSILNDVLRLEPVQYRYTTQAEDAAMNYGFIAQDVAAIFPNLARTAEDGTMGLAYSDFGVLAIAAIQEQQTQIDALQQENAELRAEMDEIKTMISQGTTSTASTTPGTYNASSSTGNSVLMGSANANSSFSWINIVPMLIAAIVVLWDRRKKDVK